MPQIEVIFDIDADGILHVSARDVQTGKEQKIRIEAKSGLDKGDIERMVKDAELHKEEDRKRGEIVELKNEADSLSFRAGKALADYKDKLPKEVVDDVQSKIDAVKSALESNDVNRIRTAKTDLETHMQKIGEAMSKAGAAAGAGADQEAGTAHAHAEHEQQHQHQSSPKPGEENIVDADVEIIDDEKK